MNSTASVLGTLYVLSELALMFEKRAKSGESRLEDKGSLHLLWIVIFASVALAFNLEYSFPAAAMSAARESTEGQAVRADVPNYATGGAVVLNYELRAD